MTEPFASEPREYQLLLDKGGTMRPKCVLHALVAVWFATVSAGTLAQTYPAKPVRLIVPFPPGGAADAVARIVGQPLSQALGQPVAVDNRPGADGAIAAEAVIKSQPDGYTLFFGGATSMSGLPTMRKNPPYDPIADFTPISLIGTYSFFLFVNSSVPAKSFADLLRYARAHPSELNYAASTSTGLVAMAQLKLLEKLDMVQVPYKGDAPATLDLVAGRVQLMFATPTAALGHVKDGRLRALATLGTNRSALLPDVPSTAEVGLEKLTIVAWSGLFGPAKLPKDVVDRLSRETRAVIARNEVRGQLDRQAFDGKGSTPEELAGYLKAQLEAWATAIREAAIPQE